MKWSELLEAGALAKPDSEVLISQGGTVTRVAPSPEFAEGGRERNGHVAHDGATRKVAAADVLVDEQTGARGDVVLTTE